MTAPTNTTLPPFVDPYFESMSTSPLRTADRCDHCGAQAYVRATWPITYHYLLLCNHHGDEFAFRLVEQGARIFRIPISKRVNDMDH